jgi:hypothetical protein
MIGMQTLKATCRLEIDDFGREPQLLMTLEREGRLAAFQRRSGAVVPWIGQSGS